MKLAEAIEIIETQAANHPAAEEAPKDPHTIKRKERCKTITTLDKSVSTGYSLVGNFVEKKQDLEPGLFLLFTTFAGNRVIQLLEPAWEEKGKNLIVDSDGNVVFQNVDRLTTFEKDRALLFDFDGKTLSLQYFAWLPRQKWAKNLWKPIEIWLETQPSIGA